MEYWIDTLGHNPEALGPILVAIVGAVVILLLLGMSRFVSGRKGLEQDRLALNAELYRLEKFASQKKKDAVSDKERAESFWPKKGEETPAGGTEMAAVTDGSRSGRDDSDEDGSIPPPRDDSDDEDDEFADIRRENLVKDWGDQD
ncbi:MAG: hypothetical protein JW941_12995 [Candidatus Coatesbacteria bacterium]|nr:hypothetical protein [Candidatus Coatesbacteria bacterium]